jgi:hypothetical protein
MAVSNFGSWCICRAYKAIKLSTGAGRKPILKSVGNMAGLEMFDDRISKSIAYNSVSDMINLKLMQICVKCTRPRLS